MDIEIHKKVLPLRFEPWDLFKSMRFRWQLHASTMMSKAQHTLSGPTVRF